MAVDTTDCTRTLAALVQRRDALAGSWPSTSG